MSGSPDATFEEVASELARVYDEYKLLEKGVEGLKARLRELVGGTEGLRRERSSRYLDLPMENKTVGVGDPDVRQSIDPGRLRERLGDDALFLRLVTVDKVTLRLDEWLQAVEDELVTEGDLLAAVGETVFAGRVTVSPLRRIA